MNAPNKIPTINDFNSALTRVNKKLAAGLWITHSSYGIFLTIMTLLHVQSHHGSVTVWLVKAIPLLIFLPAFFKQYPRTYSWLCFAILPYFVFITPYLFEGFSWGIWGQLILTVIIFNASMMTSRWLQQRSYLRWQIANTPAH